MTEEAKRRIAFAVARATGKNGNSIYSFNSSQYTSMSGSGSSFYDYSSGSHFSNSYDYGTGSHWQIKVENEKFSGFHYGDSAHFSGTVKDGSISFFDYSDSSWSSFKV